MIFGGFVSYKITVSDIGLSVVAIGRAGEAPVPTLKPLPKLVIQTSCGLNGLKNTLSGCLKG